MIYYSILLIMTFLGALASMFFKKGANDFKFRTILKNKNIYLGGFLYLGAALLNIYVLKFMPFSTVLPLTSITYIWTMIIAHYVLHETITKNKVIGVTLICVGAFMIR